MTDPSAPSQPPPNYGSAPGYHYPQPGQVTNPNVVPSEPPPKYELPNEGPYSQAPANTGYPAQGAYNHGYQGQPGPVTNTIIVTQAGFGQGPQQMDCPNCHCHVTTAVSHQAGGLTWLSAGLLCLFGDRSARARASCYIYRCWMGCCLIPFCINDLQDVEHRCPNCGRHLGTYSRM